MHRTEFLGPVVPGELLTNCRFVTKCHVNEFISLYSAGCSVGAKRQRRVEPVASEETLLGTQEDSAAVSQGLQIGSQAVGCGRALSRGAHTGSQAVGRGRAVGRGAHTGSQAVGRGRALSRGAHTGSQAVGRGRAVGRGAHTASQVVGRGRTVGRGAHTASQVVGRGRAVGRGAHTGSQAVGRGRASRGRDQVRAQRHSATVEELPNEREGNIDEDESDIEIEENPLPPHREDVTHVFVHDVGWKKNVGRALCPAATHGYSQHAQFHLYNAAEATEFEYFLSCFPCNLVDSICCLMTTKGQEQRKGVSFNVSMGEYWLFMGYLMYMLCHPIELPIQDYWEGPLSTKYGACASFVKHDLGKFGLSYSRFRRLMQAFTLPQYSECQTEPFSVIRRFVDEWNQVMQRCISPGPILVVDESMGQWLGKGMPGLMFVARKPTPNGREAHTTADADTGCIINYEIYEGKTLMADKKHVRELGAGTAAALRLTAPWAHTGRIVILDSAFASLKAAKALAGAGLYMVGNVKTAHTGFPKGWLNSQVTERGERACATHAFTVNGQQWEALAALDKDKQPMSLIGTAGTTNMGKTLVRNFTVRHSNGDWQTRTAHLEQWHIHEIYRSNFNVIDKHNGKRQGFASFEETWKTHSWWVRDFQVLFGISEVNAYLLWVKFKPGQEQVSLSNFRMQLCHQMLNNKWIIAERNATCTSRSVQPEQDCNVVHQLINCDRGHCRMCGLITRWRCECLPQSPPAPGAKRRKDGSAMYLCPASKRRCLIQHIEGNAPVNLKKLAALQKWNARN